MFSVLAVVELDCIVVSSCDGELSGVVEIKGEDGRVSLVGSVALYDCCRN